MSSNIQPNASALIGPREKEVLKDLKRLVKEANVATATGTAASELWTQTDDRAHAILSDFELVNPSNGPDNLATIAIHLAQKERAVSLLVLHHVVTRGLVSNPASNPSKSQLTVNEYTFAMAGLFLVVMLSEDRRWQAANKALTRAWTLVRTKCTHLDRRDDDRIARLFDVYLLFNARAAYLANEPPDESMRHLSQMTAHKLVLDSSTYAIVALVKCLTQVRQGHLADALVTLQRRDTQQRALQEIDGVASSLAGTSIGADTGSSHARKSGLSVPTGANGSHSPSLSGRHSPHAGHASKIHPQSPLPSGSSKRSEGFGKPTDVFHFCHDLHIYLAAKLDKEDEAKDKFTEFKADYNRGSKFEAFLKHVVESDVIQEATAFLGEWAFDVRHLMAYATELKLL
ncbi:hypothetical protein BCR44DRAFT_121737 [Catenaria anguillulae PL171]|uniref:Uncharacterized protein n=1 Tax=Catenaria anguillulae PL171 TaxID=765915 RepID=A0A1Y2HE53_9FUNG|nr:hypothetical protein BCR44DRAFT_121737 [Catenaria anguillulae PL171]